MKLYLMAVVFGLVSVLCLACTPSTSEMADDSMQESTEMASSDMASLMSHGETVFMNNCAGCHGAEGEGVRAPAHAGNQNLADAGFVLNRVLNGQGNMPAFGDRLSDEDIAGVATFIRNSWGNAFGEVEVAQVSAAR